MALDTLSVPESKAARAISPILTPLISTRLTPTRFKSDGRFEPALTTHRSEQLLHLVASGGGRHVRLSYFEPPPSARVFGRSPVNSRA